jgi:hypothetical protein
MNLNLWNGSAMEKSVFLARPHPDLLPRGEGTAINTSSFADVCPANPVMGSFIQTTTQTILHAAHALYNVPL